APAREPRARLLPSPPRDVGPAAAVRPRPHRLGQLAALPGEAIAGAGDRRHALGAGRPPGPRLLARGRGEGGVERARGPPEPGAEWAAGVLLRGHRCGLAVAPGGALPGAWGARLAGAAQGLDGPADVGAGRRAAGPLGGHRTRLPARLAPR